MKFYAYLLNLTSSDFYYFANIYMLCSLSSVLMHLFTTQAGGCCHTFIDKNYEFDVGIHYIGEMQYQSISKTYFDQITDGQVEWEPLGIYLYSLLMMIQV